MVRKYCEMFKNPWTPAIVQIRWIILIIGDLREFGIDCYDYMSLKMRLCANPMVFRSGIVQIRW